MDPTANLLEQIEIANRMQSCKEPAGVCAGCAYDGARLAELALALDGWLRGGGFLPSRWATPTRG